MEQILDFDMGEPLGLFESYLVADADGLRWWKGDPPEMRSYFTKQSRVSRQASTWLYEQT